MFRIAIFTFDPETKALLTRLLDFLERNQQAEVDAVAAELKGSIDAIEKIVKEK